MDNRLFPPATDRNRDPTAEILSRILLKSVSILEIGSGIGEHGVYFKKDFKK